VKLSATRRLSTGALFAALAVAVAFSAYTLSARALSTRVPANAPVGTSALTWGSAGATAKTAMPRARAGGIGHLQVTEIEYRLILSRGVVKAGPVNLEAIDAGMDPHDLRLRHSGSGPELGAPELTSGKRWDGVVDLKPGSYHLWCSLPEHARLGMHATLRVVR
jgi:uncharacterized cupredoxin-like copper-binding protein